MALRARPLTDKAPTLTPWPWHAPVVGSVRVSMLKTDHRRLDAESYLTNGYGIRQAIEDKTSGWVHFGKLAHAWMPSRIKMVLVSRDDGTPYLNTSQVFSARPQPRKWLALGKTVEGDNRLVKQGQILVMRSATVGRAIVASKIHENSVISDHFLRIDCVNQEDRGWIYAYVRSKQALSMITGSQYASVIRHIEPQHLEKLPVPLVDPAVSSYFQEKVDRIVTHRNDSLEHSKTAERLFSEGVGLDGTLDWGEKGFSVSVERLMRGNRRLEAANHVPACSSILEALKANGRKTITLASAGFDVWVPSRYKRIPTDNGVAYVDSSEILEINPVQDKQFADAGFGDAHKGRVQPGWVLMPCSGQVYGIVGTVVIAGENLLNKAVSNHVMRIVAKEDAKLRVGFVATALGHPTLGRPLVKAMAFGASVPEISASDIAGFPVVRLGPAAENAIADAMEAAAREHAKAEELEVEIAEEASLIVSEFLLGTQHSAEDQSDIDIARDRLSKISEMPSAILRGEDLIDRLAQWEA